MTANGIDEALKIIKEYINKTRRTRHGVIYIILSNPDAWSAAIPQLEAICGCTLTISSIMHNGRLPSGSHVIYSLKTLKQNVLVMPLMELIMTQGQIETDDLLDRLDRLKSTRAYVPLYGDINQVCDRLRLDLAAENVICVDGYYVQRTTRFIKPDKTEPDDHYGAVSIAEWLRLNEKAKLPLSITVCTDQRIRHTEQQLAQAGTAYALLAQQVEGFELAFDRRALSEGDWRVIYELCVELPDFANVQDFIAHFAKYSSAAERPRKLCAWLAHLDHLSAGDYLCRVLSAVDRYDDIADAVIMELIAEFDTTSSDDAQGFLSPGDMSADAWLELRAERAQLIRRLGIAHMPQRFWDALAKVPMRRKLLYTSLCTIDEREYCCAYLCDAYHLSYDAIAQRPDIKRLYPELLTELKGKKKNAAPQ